MTTRVLWRKFSWIAGVSYRHGVPGTIVHGILCKARDVVEWCLPESLQLCLLELSGLPGRHTNTRKLGSLEWDLSGPGHRIIYNCWGYRGENLLVSPYHHHLDREGGHLSAYIPLDRTHHQLDGRIICFVVRSTTRLLCTGGRQKHGMLLSKLFCSSITVRICTERAGP